MPELFIELFSEEIPARLQEAGAQTLRRGVDDALAALLPTDIRLFWGPRRVALAAQVAAATQAQASTERGPRLAAPEQAVAGFLRKHAAERSALRQEGEFWVLDRSAPAEPAAALVAAAMPGLLRRFAWPKSMRWGGTSAFTWIRPLRRIVCLLDGAIVPFTLAQPGDDGHGLASADLTEGHRGHAPSAMAVRDVADWQRALRAGHVVADAAERAALIQAGLAAAAAAQGVTILQDAGLVEEVAGLVEWPVALLGRIDDAFMDLPPEVMQVSMRINQRYFATRAADGAPAPWFAFAANIDAPDGGAAIIAGNERVLRARFSDARHFWDLDRRTKLADRVAALDGIVFQASLGTQGARVARLVALAGTLAPLVGADPGLAQRAALLAKADLTTGMVGEFPELQGVMGGYYAAHDGEDAAVCDAVRGHYAPKGAGDSVPTAPVSMAVALADKFDQLASFFAIGERPTGSGDPYALRRAALGVIRIIRENRVRLDLREPIRAALEPLAGHLPQPDEHGWGRTFTAQEIQNFILDRHRILLKAEGKRADILAAVDGAHSNLGRQWPSDLERTVLLSQALTAFMATQDGKNLLVAYKRASNILRIEDAKDGPHPPTIDPALFELDMEHRLGEAMDALDRSRIFLEQEKFTEAMSELAALRMPLDAFFQEAMVNAPIAAIRRNRLGMLQKVQTSMNVIANFAAIETAKE